MGRIVDLFGEVAAESEEGPEGLVLSPDAWDRLRQDWRDEDIEDALQLVQESLLQGELVDSADSLSSRLVEVLGTYGEAEAYHEMRSKGAALPLDLVAHIVRRVARLEEILAVFRDGASPDRRAFDQLQRRLMDVGIEDEMQADADEDDDRTRRRTSEDDEEE